MLDANLSTAVKDRIEGKYTLFFGNRDSGGGGDTKHCAQHFNKPVIVVIDADTYQGGSTHYNRVTCCMLVKPIFADTTFTVVSGWESVLKVSLL